MASNNPYVYVNTGFPTPSLAGKIEQMNGYNYPNIPFKVYDGYGSTLYLPFRCSAANFTEESVYTWQHGMPNNKDATNITTMNMMNFQLQHQNWVADEYICEAGVGNKTCNENFNSEYNSYKQNEYGKNSTFLAVNNCGSRIFSHGTGNQTTIID